MALQFGVIFFCTLVLIFIVRNNAKKLGLVDIPNARSTHKQFTPRSAGVAFFVAAMTVTPFFYLDLMFTYEWTTLALFMVFIVGLLDDHHDTSPYVKFMVIIVATMLLTYDNLVIDELGTCFGTELSLGWAAIPFTIFAVVGFTNALNLMDGLDGLAAIISLVILGSFFAVGLMHDDLFMMVLSSVFISTSLAFLVYNWYPASIFMGDSGSLTLGFVISILAIKSLAYLPAVSVLFIAALPILDTLIAIVRRKREGRSSFSPDTYHMHHVLKRLFWDSTPMTVLFLGFVQAIYSFTALQFDKNIDEGILLMLFLLNVIVLYMILTTLIKKQKSKT